MNINVVIRTQFHATHCWPGCDIESVQYLQHEHRHVFHVTMKWKVTHTDRDIEFISKKNVVEDLISYRYKNKFLGAKSCEMIAVELMKEFPSCIYCSVFEDDENGAEVTV
jgi:hypothetical protein